VQCILSNRDLEQFPHTWGKEEELSCFTTRLCC